MADPNAPLEAWLEKHHARRIDEADLGNQRHVLYAVNGHLLIVVLEPGKRGWNIFIPASPENSIPATLKAVELACGLQAE